MKPLAFNLKGAKKIAGTGKSSTFDVGGHHIIVQHDLLPNIQRKQLSRIPIHKGAEKETLELAHGGEITKAHVQKFAEKGLVEAPYETQASDEQPQDQNAMMSQAASQPPAQAVPPAPADSKTQAQRDAYNAVIDQRFSNMADYPPDKIAAMKFGPNGEEPQSPNYPAMQATIKDKENLDTSEKNKSDWQAIENEKINSARKGFGLSPVAGPSGLNPSVQQVSDGAPQVPQGQPSTQNPMGSMDTSGLQMNAVGMGLQGIQQQQKAETDFGKIQAQAASDEQTALKEYTDPTSLYNTGITQKQTEIAHILKEVGNGTINPNHYMENQGAAGKVSTAIGLLLGGISSGLTHQGNPALEVLQKQIDRDIQAQQSSIGNKLNLVSHYTQQLGDARAGAAFAKATQASIYAAKINQAAGLTADPMAKARAMQASAQFINSVAIPALHQAQAYSMLYGNEGSKLAPEQKLLLMKNTGLINEQQYAEGNKEVGEIQNKEFAKQKLLQAFDQTAKQNTIGGRVMHAGFEPASSAEMDNLATPLMKDKDGRVNEFEFNAFKALKPQAGDFDNKVMAKRQGISDWVDTKSSTPTLQGLGIIPKKNLNIGFKPRGQ